MTIIITHVGEFEGENLEGAARQLAAELGAEVPDAISVHSGKAHITEAADGDRFWITLIGNVLGEDAVWGYGDDREDAKAAMM